MCPKMNKYYYFTIDFFNVPADRCSLHDSEKIEPFLELLCDSLTYFLTNQHPKQRHVLYQFLDIVTDMRTPVHYYEKAMKQNIGSNSNAPQLLREIMDKDE